MQSRTKKRVIIAQTILGAIQQAGTLFGRGGIIVLPAPSSEEVLALHRDQQADLIIIDHDLPVMGGAQLCSKIRSDVALRDVSLIMICDRTGPGLEESQRAGANAILTGPLDAGELFSKVSHLLMVQDRIAVRMPLRITVNGRDRQTTFVGMSLDISVSGMFIESGRILQQGERLECSFTVSGHAVTVGCIVVRTQEGPRGTFQYGLKFLSLDARSFVLLEHIIRGGAPRNGSG